MTALAERLKSRYFKQDHPYRTFELEVVEVAIGVRLGGQGLGIDLGSPLVQVDRRRDDLGR